MSVAILKAPLLCEQSRQKRKLKYICIYCSFQFFNRELSSRGSILQDLVKDRSKHKVNPPLFVIAFPFLDEDVIGLNQDM